MSKEKQQQNKKKVARTKASKLRTPNSEHRSKHSDLRKQAEEKLRSKLFSLDNLSGTDLRNVFHELQVHQIELEMQNEELRTAQEDLEESRSKYADLYDFAPVGYFTFDKNGLILESNLTGAEQLAIDRSTLHKKPLSRFINRDDQDAFFLHRQEVLQKKTRQACEIRIKRMDGSEFHAQLVSAVIKDSSGHTLIRSALMNITERKKAEAAMQDSELKYRLLVDNSLVGIFKTDLSGKFLFVNEAFVTIYGYESAGEIMALNPGSFYRHHEERANVIESLMNNGSISDYEIEAVTKTGKTINVIFNATLQGDVISGMVMNITDRKQAEEELRKYRENLEELVSERKIELKEAYKQLSFEVAEKLNYQAETMRSAQLASIGELAAGVAHEINNPINGIINCAQILLNKMDPDSKEHQMARMVMKEGDRIADIVSSLLSFARESKQEKRQVYIHDIMIETLALTESQIRKESIKLILNVPSTLPDIYAQPQQIEQVFLNIINNARYAMNKKFPSSHKDKVLSISGEAVTIDDKPFVRVTFHDNGVGIPYEDLGKIMNPFFTTKPPSEGTGLGLSISHGIISDHRGILKFDSISGEFTRVTIDLPAGNSKMKNSR